MKTITWNRRAIDGSKKALHFVRLFTQEGEEGKQEVVRNSLEVIARRQGLIYDRQEFMDEMDKLSLEHENALLSIQTPEDYIMAGEYYGTRAMLVAVRYGLSGSDEITTRVALRRLSQFVDEAYSRSSRELVGRVS